MAIKSKSEFADKLATALYKSGISQAELARMMGVSKPTVSDWVHGAKYPRVDKMRRLSEIIGMDLGELIGRNESLVGSSDYTQALTPEEASLLTAYRLSQEPIRDVLWRILGASRPLIPDAVPAKAEDEE